MAVLSLRQLSPLRVRALLYQAAALAALLKSDGLYFVGLDVIGNFLTEVNVTSPTGVQEINALNGVHLESQVIDFVEREATKLATS